MQHKIHIIGDGIVALLLAWQLKDIADVHIYGDGNTHCASLHGAALINPNAYGPKASLSFQEIIEAANQVYKPISEALGYNYFKPLTLLCHKAPNDKSNATQSAIATSSWMRYWQLDKAVFEVEAYKIDTKITTDLRTYFASLGNYHQQAFTDDLIQADSIQIYCEGAQARHNPDNSAIKFTANKGDILYMHIPDLPQDTVYDFDYKLVPLGKELFWVGSNHIWTYDKVQPEPAFKEEVAQYLQQHLKVPYTIREHISVERPTIAGQQPIMAWQQHKANTLILNGFGTKGFSNAPYYTQKAVETILVHLHKMN